MTDALTADACAFTRTVDPRSCAGVELEGLVSSESIPMDREAREKLGLILDSADLSPLLFLTDTMVFRPGHALVRPGHALVRL